MSSRNSRRTRKASEKSDSGDSKSTRSDEDEEEYEEVKTRRKRVVGKRNKPTSSDSEDVPLSRRRRKKDGTSGRVNHSFDEEISDQNWKV